MENRSEESIKELLNQLANDVKYIRRDVDRIMVQLEKDYVTKDQFDLVRKITYGLISLLLISLISAIMNGVLK